MLVVEYNYPRDVCDLDCLGDFICVAQSSRVEAETSKVVVLDDAAGWLSFGDECCRSHGAYRDTRTLTVIWRRYLSSEEPRKDSLSVSSSRRVFLQPILLVAVICPSPVYLFSGSCESFDISFAVDLSTEHGCTDHILILEAPSRHPHQYKEWTQCLSTGHGICSVLNWDTSLEIEIWM